MIDLSGTITVAQLTRELGVSVVTAAKICKESGAGTKVGNSTLYDREAVRNVVIGRNLNVLMFLGLAEAEELEDESPELEGDTLYVDASNMASQYL